MEGTVYQGVSSRLPDHWQSVPYTDSTCLGWNPIYASRNLTGINGPSINMGIYGVPYAERISWQLK